MSIQLLFIASKILFKHILKICSSLGYQWAKRRIDWRRLCYTFLMGALNGLWADMLKM